MQLSVIGLCGTLIVSRKASRAKLLVPILDVGCARCGTVAVQTCSGKLASCTNAMTIPSVDIQSREVQSKSIVRTLLSQIDTTDWHNHSGPDVQSQLSELGSEWRT